MPLEKPPSSTLLRNGNRRGDPANAPRCHAHSKRTGLPCRQPALRGKSVCRMHGGKSPGAPRGERHGRYVHGLRTIEHRAKMREVLDHARAVLWHYRAVVARRRFLIARMRLAAMPEAEAVQPARDDHATPPEPIRDAAASRPSQAASPSASPARRQNAPAGSVTATRWPLPIGISAMNARAGPRPMATAARAWDPPRRLSVAWHLESRPT